MDTRYTLEGNIRASGLGGQKEAYERLLLNLCKSGCTLPKIRIVPTGFLGVLIDYTIEGTEEEIATYRREAGC